MKFFTIEDRWFDSGEEYMAWETAHDDEKSAKIAYEQYQQHLANLHGILPDHVLALDRLQGIEDGLLVAVKHDRDQKKIALILRCGDLPMGYYDLILRYEGADISPEHERALARIARTTINAGYHESDLASTEIDKTEDGRIAHRFAFHPGCWFEIRCSELTWRTVPQPNRNLPDIKDRFPGYPTFNLSGISEISKQPYIYHHGMCKGDKCAFLWFGNIIIKEEEKPLYLRALSWLKEYSWSVIEYTQDSDGDHDHCMFCWQKIAEVDYSDADAIQTAYLNRTIDEDERITIDWICPSCFEQLRKTFRWRVADKHALK